MTMLPTFSKFLSRSSPAFACRRCVSSKANHWLPHDERMGAAVSLYHQSNTFITPENLSAVIDQAFTQPVNIAEDQKKHNLYELWKIKESHGESTKFFLGRDDGSSSSESMGPGWTESKSRRLDRVYRALMGTQKDGRPSWLALKENSERLRSRIGNDNRG